MPKYAGRRRPTQYVARRAKATKKPYGNRYGNDAFVKIESINPLATRAGVNDFVSSAMRVIDNPVAQGAAVPANTYLRDQKEFDAFALLYARYEVVGMKGEVTLNSSIVFSEANLGGGLAPRADP